jgi:PAB1-binding protein PBP1
MYAGKVLLKEYKTISKKYMHELYDIYKDFLNARVSEMKSVERLATDPSWFFEDMVTQLSYITANNSEKITTFFFKRGD